MSKALLNPFIYGKPVPTGRFVGRQEQVRVLFAEHFELTAHDRRDGLPRSENLKFRGLSHLVEAVYVLRRLG